jgi:hypothetical protein
MMILGQYVDGHEASIVPRPAAVLNRLIVAASG